MLLDRNTTMRVTGVTKFTEGGYLVDATVVPK
jgi:hypothetical protein